MRLGCISHALLTAEAIAARGLTLAGWVANRVDPDMMFPDENIESIREHLAREYDAPLLGIVPHLNPASPELAADQLDINRLLQTLTRNDAALKKSSHPSMRIDDMTQLNIAPTPADTAAANNNANTPQQARNRWRAGASPTSSRCTNCRSTT